MNTPTFLTYIIWDVSPDLFTVPFIDIPLRWYGLLFAVSFLISQQIMYYIYKKEGRAESEVDTLTLYAVVATVLGARLGHVLFYNPAYYWENPEKILMTWEGGLASHGGGIGMFIALYLFARKTKVPYLWVLDRVAVVTGLIGCMIRTGNLMNSEMIGIPTDVPWAFVFVVIDNIPRHPAQLYEAICCLLIFGCMFWLWLKKRDTIKNGFIFSWFLIALFSLRFFDEFLKVDQEPFEEGMFLNMGQILSIPFILAGIVILIAITKKNRAIAPGE